MPAGKIAQGRYVHFSKRERANSSAGVDAELQVTFGRIDLVACPRIISEVVAYVYKSQVFRSNFSALWAASSAASSRVKFRHRLDAKAMSYRYKLQVELSVGGINIVCPESSSSDDCFRLSIPPIQIANNFTDAAECCAANTTVRLSSSIAGVEEDLINFSLAVQMKRQLSLAHSSQEVAVMDLDIAVGTIAIAVSQPQVALIWRSAFANVAEVRQI